MIFDSDSFFYGVSDVQNNLMIACKYELGEDPRKEISDIIVRENLADHYYSAVNIYSKFPLFSFIPAPEYYYGVEEKVAANSFKVENHQLGMDVCSEENLHIIHGFESGYDVAFSAFKNDPHFRHVSLAYLQNIKEDGVYVNVLRKEVIILVRRNGSFVFYNQFTAKTLEDYLYFIMLAYDQLGMNPSLDRLYYHGDGEKISALKELLAGYVADLRPFPMGFENVENTLDTVDLYLASICE